VHSPGGAAAENNSTAEHAASDDGMAEAPPAAGEAPATELALREQLARLQGERDDLFRTLVRRQADFENYRKRIERERRDDQERFAAGLIAAILPVLDAFERALASHNDPAYEEYRKGLELIHRQLLEVLSRHRLERIETRGRPFDPHYHQAVERVETAEAPEQTILEELQPGYKLGDRVLRPSMVRVAVPPAPGATEGQSAVN